MTMNYRSISDLNSTILRNLHRLPRDLDLVVGVPRSGLLAANLLALMANIRLSDLDAYVEGRVYTSGVTKAAGMREEGAGRRKVLVLDDSIYGGGAMETARARVEAAGLDDEVIFAAVYGLHPSHSQADLVFETVPDPRLFQWNFMHHKFLERSCVDIDGVLCHDPSLDENDDGPAYLRFMTNARPLYHMTHPIGTLVTSRLERYRPQTEAWLARTGLRYGKLVMLDLPSAAERRRLAAHGRFKADYYRTSDAILFIESENQQARTIARVAGKPVLCLETHSLIEPSLGALLSQVPKVGSPAQGLRIAKQATRTLIGPHRYAALRRLKGRLSP
jgi:uncharacterized HAD superfamily protein/adenine/guanine phosphoribosyltransferase-like PRPP-binding protein